MVARRKKAKMNIPMCVACVLFCCTLFSFHFTGGLYARYTTHDAGSDSARVIKFGNVSIKEEGDGAFEPNGGKFIIIPGVPIQKKATVSFSGSEAATYVFVEVRTTDLVLDDDDDYTFTYKHGNNVMMQWSIAQANGWKYLAGTKEPYVYYLELNPNEELTDVDIIKDGNIDVSRNITKSIINNMGDISISLRAVAVQASGFDSATEAWNAVK